MSAEPVVRVRLAGVPIDAWRAEAVLAELDSRLQQGRRARVNFVNAHCVNVAHRDPAYRATLERSELVLPDGTGVLTAARLLGLPLRDNLNGTDLVPRLLALLARTGSSVFLFGAAPGVAEDAATALRARFPGLAVAGTRHGYLEGEGEAELLRTLGELRPSVLLVAMGVPRQELWLDRNWDRLPVILGLGVGAFFDFSAGRVSRAPAWVRRLGLEWSYRLIQEPARLWRRYLLGNLEFAARVAAQRGRAGSPPG